MKQNNNEVQYIWHDGATIPEDLLISMAKTAGCYESAKPYLFSLMAHGLNHGIRNYIYKVNEIRDYYHVVPRWDRTLPATKPITPMWQGSYTKP